MNRVANALYASKKILLVLWIILIIGFGFYAAKLPSVLGGNGFEMKGMYKDTEQLLVDKFDVSEAQIIVLFEKKDGVSDSKFQQTIAQYMQKAKDKSDASKVDIPTASNKMIKGSTAYGIIHFNHDDDGTMDKQVEKIRTLSSEEKEMSVKLTGGPIIEKDMNTASQADLAKAEAIGIPVALVVLLLAFGGVVAAAIPLMIGIVTVVTTMGVVYFFHPYTELSIFILNVIPMIGLALSIDFALLFINRFKEEIQTKSVEQAIKITIQTAGRSVIFSGLCVFIGLAGMLFIQVDIFQNVALGGMAVVFIAVFSALTLLPSILAILGTRINRLRILKISEQGGQSRWRSFATFVMKKPVTMTIVSLIILLIALIPVRDMHLEIPSSEALPTKYESRQAFDTYNDTFTNKNTADVYFVLEAKQDMLNEKSLKNAFTFIKQLKEDSLVKQVDSISTALNVKSSDQLQAMLENPQITAQTKPAVDSFINGHYMLIKATLDTDQNSDQAKDFVRKWKKKRSPFTVHIGGYPKFEQEIFDEIYEKAPYGLALVLFSTYVILMIAFRSVLIPLKAIIMNILSLTATFGLLVWLFQNGHLGLTQSNIALVLPVFVFGLVFGLSMDYEVFLISRIHEVYHQTRDNNVATVEGLASTSKIITSAALIMIVITGAFAFTDVTPVKQMGVGIALAIFIDATIVRMLLVPSLMKLLGDANWWFFTKKRDKSSSNEQLKS
ncbi:MMPL family transporter [Priestia megaterium]|uniref:MMPL family transporter n=1 Tax=Priestia megaterium TaxID=1404 RepID=UPI001EDA98BC|nr:MMPL family transporter [Priestia megaterium]MDH3160888.1 MMPL family transporter [Priestia megaterium]MED4115522.1 MMPL family transporter [Priestia megaterium]UKJ82987.1 MMPL family transporter [Priestia megaterium]